jgi:hypothetical protein
MRIFFWLALSLTNVLSTPSLSQDVSHHQAKKLLERLSSTKVPIDDPRLLQMTPLLLAGQWQQAAEIATTHPGFLNLTVKQMAQRMSTREETFRLSLNDFGAMVIGVTRDNLDARTLLTENFYYRGDPARIPANITVDSNLVPDFINSNNHYEDLDRPEIDLGVVLMRVEGQVISGDGRTAVANPDPAGLLTTRSFMGSHADAGTNRRLVEYTFRQFMCVPMGDWADTKVSDAHIGRDIDRFPGGDHMKFQTSCKGCHTQMDGFRGAFARWDFQGGRIVHSAVGGNGRTNGIFNKMNKNQNVFAHGYVTTDSSFVNNARGPSNEAFFGWRGSQLDRGADVRQFGQLVANSKRFSQCMVKRVYDTVCRQDLNPKTNKAYLELNGNWFEQQSYNIKRLFERIAVQPECLGGV